MAQTKSIINNKDEVVKDMLEAIQRVYPGLFVQNDLRIVLLNRERRYRVGLISGGGSGHEPFPGGYVGEGMLTASIVGDIFTGPPIGNILATILSVGKLNKGGILLVMMNYSGDVLNYSAAMEVARVKGYKIDSVIVSDDVAQFGQDNKGLNGRRGLVGVTLMAKILGGYAKEGKHLFELVAIGRSINYRLGTLGVTFKAGNKPGVEKPLFKIPEGKVEFGMGIHGEAGITTIDMPPLNELVKEMLNKIVSCLIISAGVQVVVIVNNLGALSQLELSVIAMEVYKQIEGLNMKIERFYVGTLISSLNTRGFQICLLNITNRTQWLPYLDEETEAFAWPGKRTSRFLEKFPTRIENIELKPEASMVELTDEGMKLTDKYGALFRKTLREISKKLLTEVEYLNMLDTEAGDGDCGTTLGHLAEAILRDLNDLPVTNVPQTFVRLSKIAEKSMNGTLGAIFTLMLIGAAKDCEDWETSWLAGIEMIQKYSRARLGDRTLLDALIPACKGFMVHIKENGDFSWPIALLRSLEIAEEGCEATKHMIARVGRASFVDPSKINDVDPGAYAVVVILRVLVKTLVTREDVYRCPM